MKISTLLIAPILLASPLLAWGGNPSITPGLWKVSIIMQMNGMTLPPQIIRHCVTPAALKKPHGAIPLPPMSAKAACKAMDVTRHGNTVSWKMSCSGAEKMETVGTMTYYGADHYKGQTKMTMTQHGHAMRMMQSIEGWRLGNCQK